MTLTVTGSIGIDSVITPTARAQNVLGGSCVYFAAAASFFSPVRIVAAVGEDFPPSHLEVFRHFGIDTAGLEVRPGARTFRWTGQYEQNMNNRQTLQVELNVLAEESPPIPDNYRDTRYLFLANTHPAAQMDILAGFPRVRLVVADTMDLWIRTARPELEQLLQKLDGLVLNDAEAAELTGETNMVAASSQIVAMGPKFVIIKKGEHGCLLRHTDGIGVMHAYPARTVVDPTGAGDSFAGGLMGYLASTDRVDLPAIKRAMAYGTIVASFNIESFSLNRLKEISRRDIDRRLSEYADIIRFDD
ncbi:MAG TPA: PfkB family carbohydrate kinase [Phycisphaeraceae bacterium]